MEREISIPINEDTHNSTLTTKVHVHRERNGSALVRVNPIAEVDAILTLKAALCWNI